MVFRTVRAAVQSSVVPFAKCFCGKENTAAAAITAAVYRGPSSKLLPFLTCKVLLLPFPSCPCAAKPLSNPLERGCNYCFLAHLGNNLENQTFFSQARPDTLGCWWRKLSDGCIISCPSELSWVNKELCFGVVLHYRSSGTI